MNIRWLIVGILLKFIFHTAYDEHLGHRVVYNCHHVGVLDLQGASIQVPEVPLLAKFIECSVERFGGAYGVKVVTLRLRVPGLY